MEKELEFRFSMLSENGWFLACVVGRFFCCFFFVARKVRFSRAKAKMGTKKKTMGEGARGEGSEKNAFSPRPLPQRFLFQPRFSFRAPVTLSSKHNKTASYAGSLAPMSEC